VPFFKMPIDLQFVTNIKKAGLERVIKHHFYKWLMFND